MNEATEVVTRFTPPRALHHHIHDLMVNSSQILILDKHVNHGQLLFYASTNAEYESMEDACRNFFTIYSASPPTSTQKVLTSQADRLTWPITLLDSFKRNLD